ncbi:hypothetical protein [Streptomyces sp. NPDC048272]|uniref:hypothetical protein n=1 Tax=Streptomyces sp. NPDC048272 TaxID=3154616 RepID=UPI00342E1A00
MATARSSVAGTGKGRADVFEELQQQSTPLDDVGASPNIATARVRVCDQVECRNA